MRDIQTRQQVLRWGRFSLRTGTGRRRGTVFRTAEDRRRNPTASAEGRCRKKRSEEKSEEREAEKEMDEVKFLIVAVCITVIFVVSLVTDCIKQRSRDRYWRELHEQQNKDNGEAGIIQPPEYEYKDLGDGRGWLSQKKK